MSATIRVGRPATYELIVGSATGYGVYRKTITATMEFSYFISEIPPLKERDALPSCLVEFKTEKEACSALQRWTEDPEQPAMLKPPRGLGGFRRNSNRKRTQKHIADQTEMTL